MRADVHADVDTPGEAGRRSARQARARRRRRWRRGAALAAVLIAVAAAGLLIARGGWGPSAPEPRPGAGTGDASPGVGEQQTLLLLRVPRGDGAAAGATLLAAGPGEDDAVVVFLPVGTLVDVPGFGLERLGAAYQYGGAGLAQASVENVLGIQIDAVASVTNAGLADLLEPTGGLEVAVDEPLVRRGSDGTAQVRFDAGAQVLEAEQAAEFWSFRNRGEDELATLPRQQEVLGAALDAVAADSEVLDDMPVGDALDTDAEPGWVHDLLEHLAAARAEGDLSFTLLPVEPFGSDASDGSTYRPRDDAIAELVSNALAASVPDGDGDEVVRLQVLNGVGVPGVGQAVDRRLDGERFRLVRTDNAAHFDFTETQILVYDETPESLAAARRVQERLGVGTIRVSRQAQSIVDVTIVVGADFLDDQS